MTNLWYWMQGSQHPGTFKSKDNEALVSQFREFLRMTHNMTSSSIEIWKLKSPIDLKEDDIQERLRNIFENLEAQGEPMHAIDVLSSQSLDSLANQVYVIIPTQGP
ncbi:hypothetical protein FRB94_010652 [Tulasnella sp. JGI-2019a]|nr:hypothetical protein FRB94_010652 [Tulasnella sp. JGI-2019a]